MHKYNKRFNVISMSFLECVQQYVMGGPRQRLHPGGRDASAAVSY